MFGGFDMKAYILLCEGFEEVEALTAADILMRAGIEAVPVSPYGENTVCGSHGFGIVTVPMKDSDFADADAIVLPGGMPGTKNLAASAAVIKAVKAYYESGKVVGAICAAPSVLGSAGILKGHKATCFPGFEDKLGGGEYVNKPAVISGNIVTGKSMGCAVDFGLALTEKLLGAEAARKVEASVYRK